ncbi:UNVERIFIED_CONTAM: hypothetical protein Sindi_2032000 [Sesamum indicum]
MLAKQFWRVLTEPERLSSYVLKARYFPNSSILDANSSNNPSFTWRSMVATKDIIKQGERWRVGTGKEINIWTDPWIPHSYVFKVTPITSTPGKTTVDTLIDPTSMQWNRGLVLETFHPLDSEAILDAIPIARNLEKRMGYATTCPLFGDQLEDVGHALLKCPFARLCWCICNIQWAIISGWHKNKIECMLNISKKLDKYEFGLFLAIYGCYGGPEIEDPEVGVGIVARDSAGKWIGWVSKRFDLKATPKTIEAMAAREAI